MARSTCRSQNVQSTSCSDHFWKLRCRKSAHRCGAKHISKSKVPKKLRVRTTFGCLDVVSRGRRKGLCTLSKVSKTCGFCSSAKNDGRRGAFEEDLQRCIFRGRRSTRDMFIRAVRSFIQVEWKNRKTHWYEAVSSALNFPFLKEVSQNCFVFDVVNFEN